VVSEGWIQMKYKAICGIVIGFATLAITAQLIYPEGKEAASTVQVHLVVTDQKLNDDGAEPVIRADNVQVKQGKNQLKVDQLIPARDENATMQLMLLIDDTCDSSIGNNLNDLRDFVKAQPATTVVGLAYMSNATIQIVQNFTPDHTLVANAIRLPRGSTSTMDSPYLSLVSLVKAWPQQKVRREVLMVSDGIDRLRGQGTSGVDIASPSQIRNPRPMGAMTTTETMPSISIDADTASNVSQRSGVIVHSIYSPGVGRLSRNAWEAQLGQSGVSKIADETGGEYFALGTQNPVSFKPYLDRLQKVFGNQYFLVFQAVPKKKEGLQRVKVSTQAENADLAAADNVFVPAATTGAGDD
jgi:hypothetical protein